MSCWTRSTLTPNALAYSSTEQNVSSYGSSHSAASLPTRPDCAGRRNCNVNLDTAPGSSRPGLRTLASAGIRRNLQRDETGAGESKQSIGPRLPADAYFALRQDRPILPLQNGATFAKPDSVAAVVVMLGSGDAYFILGTETVPRCMSTAARTCDVPVTGPAGQRTPTCQVPRGDRTPSLRRSGYRRRGRSFRSPPPTRSVASKMITRRPSRAAVYAAVSARPPEPTIRRSHSVSQGTARPDYRDLMPAQSFR